MSPREFPLLLILISVLPFTEIGSSTIIFQGAKELLAAKDKPQFSRILTTISCLTTIVQINHDDEVGHIIDMVNGIQVKTRYLLLIVTTLSKSLFQNKTINYNVRVDKRETGEEYCKNLVKKIEKLLPPQHL